MGESSSQKAADQAQQQSYQSNLQNQQFNQALEKQLVDFAMQRYQRGDILQQPLINKLTQLSSGDPNAVISAAGPEIGQIARAGQSASANVFNRIAPGAARDVALSQIPMQQYSQTAGYLNNIINSAPQQLAELGTGQYSLASGATGQGIGAGGASTQAGSAAGNTAGQVWQEQQQMKQQTLGFLGSIAGLGGSLLTGGLTGGFSGLFGGGGGGGGGGIGALDMSPATYSTFGLPAAGSEGTG